ncbi:hypothetical protein TMES_08795 [Thalassospira mesophila]|uniref:Uncharacterized protein n=1 Tax=Thalassospira mesophila TaxID=1293891 RepID=A0A1Y2L0U8_9PROT|nr:hypothetical protein TMES_08795 [Thalassospira mesophila]
MIVVSFFELSTGFSAVADAQYCCHHQGLGEIYRASGNFGATSMISGFEVGRVCVIQWHHDTATQ